MILQGEEVPIAQKRPHHHRRPTADLERPTPDGGTAASPGRASAASENASSSPRTHTQAEKRTKARRTTGFTTFVRRRADGHPLSDAEVTVILHALRGALIGALRRRGLWLVSPATLGVVGHSHWIHPGSSRHARDQNLCLDDALGELVTECYISIFVQRLPRLQAHLAVKSNIDGLVFLNLRHFLSDKQRRHDPLGYRILRILRMSLRFLSRSGLLYVLDGPETITNATTLSFRDRGTTAWPATPSRLASLVAPWADRLAQPIAQATPSALPALAEDLGRLLPSLEHDGVTSFRVRDLAQALQRTIRQRWAVRTVDPTRVTMQRINGVPTPIDTTEPHHPFEDQAAFEALQRHIDDGIEQLDVKPKVRRYLQTLSTFLGDFAADQPPLGVGPATQRGVATTPADQDLTDRDFTNRVFTDRDFADRDFADKGLPSYRRIGAMLGIPRERLPELFATLRDLTQQPGNPRIYPTTGRSSQRRSPPPGPRASSV